MEGETRCKTCGLIDDSSLRTDPSLEEDEALTQTDWDKSKAFGTLAGAKLYERERSVRRMSLHKEENTHARFAQNLRSQPFNRDRKELEKKGTNVLTEIYKFSATLHPYLRPSFLTDTVQMLPLVNSSFFISSTHNLSETGPSRTWVDRLCKMLSS